MGRLILVSNRLPIQIQQDGERARIVKSSGGLVAGLAPVHEDGGLWVGNLGATDVAVDPADLDAARLHAVALDNEDARRHYEGYSNAVLWPLCHYLLEHVAFDSRDFDAYRRTNEAFAEQIAAVVQPGDRIWVHDYHLMLLPGMLRARLPETPIAFFLHIPFPSSEVFRTLPRNEEILRGLLGANLIGLHTYDYARHLVSSFRRFVGVEFDDDWVRIPDGRCRIGVFPLGVDVGRFHDMAAAPNVASRAAEVRSRADGRKLVLGVDRLDYTKGVPHRLEAFERLLQTREDLRDQVMLLQLAVPSRANLPSYKELKERVDRLVGKINGELEQDGQTPIHYMYRSVPPAELVALYRAADVAFVTPIRDGMNLVAKEFVASRTDDRGVLVLSEFAGAASEMGEALLHNPYDIDGTAHVLAQALAMPEPEQQRRMAALRARVEANTVHRWVQRFLAAFDGMARRGQGAERLHSQGEASDMAWVQRLLNEVAQASGVLLALDYDGTLAELAPRPEAAKPPAQLLQLLETLAAAVGLQVVVLSGRDKETLDAWFGHLGVSLVAEHGLQLRPVGQTEWESTVRQVDLSWKSAVREILEDYASRAPGARIEEKQATLVWHYREVEPAFGEWQARELLQHLSEAYANSPLEVVRGAKAVEIRPQGFDKARAYVTLRDRLGPFAAEVAVGDDRTDEELFAALPERAWSIKVGTGPTAARARLRNPEEVRELLRLLVSRVGQWAAPRS